MTDANPAVLPTARDVVVDDTNPNMQYSGGGWTGALTDRTMHWSAQAAAQFSYSYQGSDVWFYGDMGPANGAFGVVVDEYAYPAGSQLWPDERAQVMLYHVPLDRGPHTITVTNLNSTRLVLDYLVYRPMSEQPSLQSNNSRDRVASSTWVAIVLGVICLILLVLLSITLFLVHRRRRRRTSTSTNSTDPSSTSASAQPKPPTQRAGIDPFPIRYQAVPAPPADSATIGTGTGTGGVSSTQPSQVDVTTRSNAVAVDIPHAPGDTDAPARARPEPDWLRANRLVLYQGPTHSHTTGS